MKKLLMAGAVLLTVGLLFLMVPEGTAGASADDFHMDGTTLVDYTGTASNVSIPDTVEVIGRSAFENNAVVKNVTIPKSVKKIEEYAFWGCQNLESVTLGSGLTEVSDFAFSACEKLTAVSIPDTVQRIGIMSFADCISLTEIYIPPTVTDIHSTAFDGVYYLNIKAEEYSYPYRYALARGESVANVPEHLKATPVPQPTKEPVATPEPEDTLDTENVPTPVPTATPVPGVVIGSTTIVGNDAVVFVDNTDMDTLQGYEGMYTWPEDSPTSTPTPPPKVPVKEWTYYGDENLVHIELGTNIDNIERFAFSRSKLKTIQIPDGVESIEYAAFYYCDALEEVTIPDTVTYIGEKAFAGTPWLESFYDGSMVLPKNSDFLIVGDGVLIAYRGNGENIVIPTEVKYIAPDALSEYEK